MAKILIVDDSPFTRHLLGVIVKMGGHQVIGVAEDGREAFEQYKKLTKNEFVEFRRQFTLQPNRAINLSGNRVDEMALSEADKADFDSFESEAEDIIKKFRAK